MLDINEHKGCPLWEGLLTKNLSWAGLQYTCLKVVYTYCKVFAEPEIYDLFVRKTCQQCKCFREVHAAYQQQIASVCDAPELGINTSLFAERSSKAKDLGYTWVPPGIRSSSKIYRYFEQIPSEKVPKIGSTGASYREQQIAHQLPKQDLSLGYCKHLDREGEASFEDFAISRNELALDIGYVRDAPCIGNCAHCNEDICAGDLVISTVKFAESVMWHPRCFVCNICMELLVDLIYCVHENKIYCERDYAGRIKPRCAGCDEKQYCRNERESRSPNPQKEKSSHKYYVKKAGLKRMK